MHASLYRASGPTISEAPFVGLKSDFRYVLTLVVTFRSLKICPDKMTDLVCVCSAILLDCEEIDR